MSLRITKSRVDFSLPILYYGIMSNFKRYYQDKNIVFKKFVKQGFYQEDWCNFDDKNCVLNKDLE